MVRWAQDQFVSSEMKHFCTILILLYGVVQVKPNDINLGTECDDSGSDCFIVWPKELCDDDQGFILTPNYPDPIEDYEDFRTYAVQLRSCDDSKLVLKLTDGEFSLQSTANSFSVGNGDVVGSETIPPPIFGPGDDSNNLPDSAAEYIYTSTGNQMWMRAMLPQGLYAKFKIQFSVIKTNIIIHSYKSTSGTLTSPNFGASYPVEDVESRYFINVTESTASYDLLFTVDVMNINGGNGDYIKIGKGMNYLSGEYSTLLSWQLENGVQFLIEGKEANLIFKAFHSAAQPANKGFQISYKAIGKNLTTPAPPTTVAPTEPTPIPFDPTKLEQIIVFLHYNISQSKPELLEILKNYVTSAEYPPEGTIKPPLSDQTMIFKKVIPCYNGWSIDLHTCRQVQVQVEAFFIPDDQDKDPIFALTNDQIRKAVARSGSTTIKLPDDFSDIYVWSVGAGIGCVILVLIAPMLCLFLKHEKNYEEINKKDQSQKNSLAPTGVDNSAFSHEEDINQFIECGPDQDIIYRKSSGGNDIVTNSISRDESSMYRTSHQMEMLEPEMEEVILYDTSGPSLYGQSNSSQGFEYHQSRETSFIQHYSG